MCANVCIYSPCKRSINVHVSMVCRTEFIIIMLFLHKHSIILYYTYGKVMHSPDAHVFLTTCPLVLECSLCVCANSII